MKTMTRSDQSTAAPTSLLVAFELSERTWKLGFTTGASERPRFRQIPAGALDRLLDEVTKAQTRFGLAPDARVISCYEAGREAFWLHRWTVAQGWTNYIVDSSSIEVNRRARRVKTDRLDLVGLLRLLGRYVTGDGRVWRVVRVPTEAEEDARHLHRMRETLQQERTRLINRLHGLVTSQGVHVSVRADFLERLATVRRWDGTPLPGLIARLQQVWAQLESLTRQVAGRCGPHDAPRRSGDRDGPLGGAPADIARAGVDWRLVVGDRDLRLAADSEWARARRLGGRGAGALSKRGDGARSRHHACGQSSRPSHDRPAGVELVTVSAGQCVESLVSRAV